MPTKVEPSSAPTYTWSLRKWWKVDPVKWRTKSKARMSSGLIRRHPPITGNQTVSQQNSSRLSSPLIVSPTNTAGFVTTDPALGDPSRNESEPGTGDRSKSNWKPAASAAARLFLRGVRDSADAFGPLKSVAGGLCFILENCEVRPPF